MTRIRTSWELAKVSWGVLKSDRSLLWIPVLGALVSLLVLGVLGGLFALTGIDSGDNGDSLAPFGYVLIVIAYIALAFVAVFFQAALVSGANARLDGRDTSVKESIGVAGSKVHRLLPWAIVQATVSFIIGQLERYEVIGTIIGSLLGAAWNILTFLAIPIIVIEDAGPGSALKRSKTLLGRTWGENISAQVGFGLLGFVAILPAAALVGLGALVGTALLVVCIAIAVVWLAIVTLVLTALDGIFRTALYRYAAEGAPPPAFAGVDFEHAFRQTRRGGRRGGATGTGGFSGQGMQD
jgi:hypothetical protein